MIAEALNNAESTWIITGLGSIGFLVGIAVGIKKLFWSENKISPQPLLVAMEKEFVNRQEYERRHVDLEKQIKAGNDKLLDMRNEIDDRFEHSEGIFRDRFHKLDNDLGAIRLEAINGRETATEQFQKIEGRMGELKSTTEHTNALAIRTDQAVRALSSELPKQITELVMRRLK